MPRAMIVEAALILGAIQLTLGDREHKIHNIVLYPERYSWCKTTAIKQVVASPGYESVTIDNNVCVGACYSYSIPITQPAEPGELIRPYCDSCQPVTTRCYHVTLKADNKNTERAKTIQKRIQIITNCQCMPCEKIQQKDCEDEEKTLELPSDLFSILHPESVVKATFETKLLPPEEVPELFQFAPAKKPTDFHLDSNNAVEQKFKVNTKLIDLLKSIQNGDDGEYDRDQVKELFEIVESPNHDINDKKLIEFANYVNYNNEEFELDLTKLKDVLLQFKKSEELFERHRNFGLGLTQGQANNLAINQDLENLNKNAVFGLEGNHHGLSHAKGNHIAMGLVETGTKINLLEKHESGTKSHHHHVGEAQHIGRDIGHLVRGPHGSFAFTPDVKQKLSLEADMIKPNQEGMVLSYENSHSRVIN